MTDNASNGRARLPLMVVRWALARPSLTLALWAILALASLPPIAGLRVDTSTESVLDHAHPAWTFYQHSQALFGGDEILVVALHGDTPFAPAALEEVRAVSEALESLEGVRRVDSIATVPAVRASPDGDLRLDAALDDARSGEALAAEARRRLAGDRIATGNLVSEDGRTFGINVVLDPEADAIHAQLIDEVWAILHASVRDREPLVSGVPVFRVTVNAHTVSEILLFAPITGLLIIAFLTGIFRTPMAAVAGLVPGLAGATVMLAAMSLTGTSLSMVTMVLPSILLALGCAFSMHLLSAASVAPLPLAQRIEPVVLPVALSGLTTAIGLLCIALIDIDLVRDGGTFGALGVLIVTLATLSLVPALLARFPLPSKPPRGHRVVRERLGRALVRLADRRAGLIFAGWGVATLAAALALPSVQVETDATRWLSPGHPVRDHYDQIGALLAGISPINVVIEQSDAGPGAAPQSVLDDAALAAIDGLSAYLEAQPGVGKSISVADPLRQLHGGFEGDPAQPLPEGRALVEQYLLLLESVPQLEDLLTDDRGAANVMLRVDDNASGHLRGLGDLATAWWKANGPPGYDVQATGIMYEFARAEDEIAYGQLRGLGAALLIISGLILTIFGSLRLALVCLVPNLIPLVLIFGGMGLLGIPLDAGTAMLGGLALGIAVDDTIHIASFYSQYAARFGPGSRALRATFGDVLPAIAGSTLIIGCAFGVVAFSEFSITRNLGALTAVMMSLCLLADVTLLGALLVRLPAVGVRVADAPLAEDAGEQAR